MKEIGYINEEEYETLCNTPLSTSRGRSARMRRAAISPGSSTM
jgi:hypothetical protein